MHLCVRADRHLWRAGAPDHSHRYVQKTREHTRKLSQASVENCKAAKANVTALSHSHNILANFKKKTLLDFAPHLPLRI